MKLFEIVAVILSAAGGSAVIIGGLVGWLGKLWLDRITNLQKLLAEVDIDLRKSRIDFYQELWEITAVLPKWPRNKEASYEDLHQLSESLRDWYFKKGGMYLSRTTHTEGYIPLQDTLMEILDRSVTGKLSDADYDIVRDRCSTLRSFLAGDIQSRREGLDTKH